MPFEAANHSMPLRSTIRPKRQRSSVRSTRTRRSPASRIRGRAGRASPAARVGNDGRFRSRWPALTALDAAAFTFTEALSLPINCDSRKVGPGQLCEGWRSKAACGWLEDRYGLSSAVRATVC